MPDVPLNSLSSEAAGCLSSPAAGAGSASALGSHLIM